MTAAALFTGLIFASTKLPEGSTWGAYSGGQQIGDVSVGNFLFNFNDDPTTDHAPNRNQAWGWNVNDQRYGNGDGHFVDFEPIVDGCTDWEKTDEDGNVIDSGTICEGSPA